MTDVIKERNILLNSYEICIKDLYLHYMRIKCDCGECKNLNLFDSFKFQMIEFTADVIDELHSKYEDHVEGMRKIN